MSIPQSLETVHIDTFNFLKTKSNEKNPAFFAKKSVNYELSS